MEDTRNFNIEILAGDGRIDEIRMLLEPGFTQSEIDIALQNAIAYSQIEVAKYLIALGADISANRYNGAYYAAHNNELEGLKFAISQGVDININNGILLNTSIETALNTKNPEIVEWLLKNGSDVRLLTKGSLNLLEKYGSIELKRIVKG